MFLDALLKVTKQISFLVFLCFYVGFYSDSKPSVFLALKLKGINVCSESDGNLFIH